MSKEYDLVILGGGSGGYVAAIRAAQLGMHVAIVEKEKLGGTCLHHGCIPSKALLRSAEVYQQTKEASKYGVEVSQPHLNFLKVQERKNDITNALYQGVKGLIKKGKIDLYKGHGRILGSSIFSPMPGTISIEHDDGSDNTIILPKNVLIATGSQPKSLPHLKIDGKYVMSSYEALQMKELPKSIIIIGGGVIGIEWASMLVDFDVDVTVLEYAREILPSEDEEVAKELRKLLKRKGIKFITQAEVKSDSLIVENEKVTIRANVQGKDCSYTASKILVSVGRQANTENIGIENTEIEITNDWIAVNQFYQTNESHIYAIGDVIGGMQLAHVASREGIIAVEHMANQNPLLLNYRNVPACIYSSPEMASIGLTEQQAKEQNFKTKIGKFPFKAIGKALVHGNTDGFVKIIVNKETDDLLGIHMIGPHVTDMISEAGLAKLLDATPWEIAQSIHPHPTLSEIIGEAALAVDGLQIHS